MSDQEMKAAKFEIVERYNGLKQSIGVVEVKLKALGGSLSSVGEDLNRYGFLPRATDKALPFEEITRLLAERERLNAAFESAKSEMASTGLPLF